jgi:hypothetical protein
MQVNCEALRLASHGYELERSDVEQPKIKDKKTMRELQNQTISTFHDLSKHQYSVGVEEIFARLKSLPPPHSLITFLECKEVVHCM